MINNAGNPARRGIDIRRGLRELGAQEKALATPDPGTKATPVRITEPEGCPVLMMPWHGPLWATRNLVSLGTAGV